MISVYRITGSAYVEEDQYYREFTTVVVGDDIKTVVSGYLKKYPNTEILEINRLNYAGETIFNVI